MSNIGCYGPTGHCQMTAPCLHACALRVGYAPPAPGTNVVPGCTPLQPLTEADVRRIVREELGAARTRGDGGAIHG